MNEVGHDEKPLPVIITPKISHEHSRAGLDFSKKLIVKRISELSAQRKYDSGFTETDYYVMAKLHPADIETLANDPASREVIDMIWLDENTHTHLLTSVETIKAAACWRMFEARGKNIVWAVLDTGINTHHPQFAQFDTIDSDLSKSFIGAESDYQDDNGHGTHVAGIIAGALPDNVGKLKVARFEDDPEVPIVAELTGRLSGIAPLAKIVSLKVLDKDGIGTSSAVIRALEYIRKLNEGSQDIQIHGANLSLGYGLEPESYGCGHSPICEEVERAVRAGICIVISCGNDGFGVTNVEVAGESHRVRLALAMSISDPANAESAIAVGSVHKSAPHKYGVSYFSSKGPTADGRDKPDLVAPGEKIISCSHDLTNYQYIERSGTSMAAPHVSGAIAAFLSVHPEYSGNPVAIKKLFISTATDLGRSVAFQGKGMVDTLRAISSV